MNNPKQRLEYLRGEIEAERISYGELAELQSLVEHIAPDDMLLREWAGVEEGPAREWNITPNNRKDELKAIARIMYGEDNEKDFDDAVSLCAFVIKKHGVDLTLEEAEFVQWHLDTFWDNDHFKDETKDLEEWEPKAKENV